MKTQNRTMMTTSTWQIFEQAMDRLGVEGKVAVAVSGGADSMALLHLLSAWNRSAANPLDLVALTVDHGLRAEAAKEAEVVQAWAAELGIAHHTLVWGGLKPSSNIEATAREARYRLLGEWCARKDFPTLMTAHHFDDQAETFLMRLVRGSGVSGLAAMRQERPLGGSFEAIGLLRPLLQIPKKDLVALLDEVQQPWFEDPSNVDEDFMRSRLRSLRETFADLGLSQERIVATADRMSEANVVLEQAADECWQQAVTVSPFGEVTVDREALVSIAADTRRRVLARALKAVSGAAFAPRYDRLLRLEEAITSGGAGKGMTLHGCKICEKGGELSIIREVGRVDTKAAVRGESDLWDGRFHIEWARDLEGLLDEKLEILVIGEPGLKFLKQQEWARPVGVRRELLLTLPGAWRGDHLVSAPMLDFGPALFKARFTLCA